METAGIYLLRPLHHTGLIAATVCLCTRQLLKRCHFRLPHHLLDIIFLVVILCCYLRVLLLLLLLQDAEQMVVIRRGRSTVILYQILHFVDGGLVFLETHPTFAAFSDCHSRLVEGTTIFELAVRD